ncbi:carboxypeptidase-like regulatory domain-containing protein [Flavobacterium oncorhynchi]|nr:carboxypeptidase-like regulatory domain-containing protein [Flavobacterium oncorhynchi]
MKQIMLILAIIFTSQMSFAQVKTIKGLVSDQNGLPLPGVSIIIQGTKTATQSDYDGKYTIQASA